MPIVPSAISGAIQAATPGVTGPVFTQVAQAIGNAVAIWATDPSSVVLIGVVTGTVGGGSVTGTKVIIPPVPLPVNGAMAAFWTGPVSTQIATGVGIGVASNISATALYTGVSAGAIGADVAKIVSANPATLTGQLIAQLAAFDIKGPLASELAAGLGNGIATMFLTGLGFGVAVGSAGPSPGVGASKSSLI